MLLIAKVAFIDDYYNMRHCISFHVTKVETNSEPYIRIMCQPYSLRKDSRRNIYVINSKKAKRSFCLYS